MLSRMVKMELKHSYLTKSVEKIYILLCFREKFNPNSLVEAIQQLNNQLGFFPIFKEIACSKELCKSWVKVATA